MRMVSLCSAGNDFEADMHMDLVRSPPDLGQVTSVAWDQNMTLTFQDQQIHVSMRIDDRNTMTFEFFSNNLGSKVIQEKPYGYLRALTWAQRQKVYLRVKKWYHRLRVVTSSTVAFPRISSTFRSRTAYGFNRPPPVHVRSWEKLHTGEGKH